MKGLFIPNITSEMFRNGCLEVIEALMAEGEIYDIECDPSAQRWIPSYAGENVPEVGEAVLVTFKNSDGEADVFIARWGGDFYDCGYYCLSVSEVLAFMPLPTPWKGEQDG